MKVRAILVSGCLFAVLVIFSIAGADEKKAEPNQMRIGVFDSRAVAVAHFHKNINGQMSKMQKEHAQAKKAGDTAKIKELEEKGLAMQKKIHLQGFGTYPIDNILKDIKQDIEKIAKENNLDLVVSKWDIVYKKEGAAFVDITDEMVQLFEPSEKTMETIEAIKKTRPYPNDELEKMDHGKH